ncbi:MAG: DegT/DnrJ/EryC1/StrS family aminotransferase [Planctomycetaceae bacterium]|nr:DegT/DnrJ/EryC1/StrS family aminotransferase [Planctomycetaceae bacterium]
MMSSDKPAILGGIPVRAAEPVWPPCDAWLSELFAQFANDGSWGRYHGPHCPALVEALRELHQVPHVALTCSGSFGVELALRSLKLPAGSEVILSAYDYKPNFTTVLELGLRPVLVDIDPLTGQMDVSQLPDACSPTTSAVLASHLQGSLVDMRAVREFADANRLAVIEDACQMLGGTVQGRMAGTWGDVGVLSFGGSKLITAGRGGAVLTSRDDIAQRIKLSTQRGNDIYPLSEMQAAVLLPQLQQLDAAKGERIRTVASMMPSLANATGLTPFACSLSNSQPDYYKLGFRYSASQWGDVSRDDFCAAMQAEFIPLAEGFRGLHLIHAKSRFRTVGDLPHATLADCDVVAVHHPFLTSPGAAGEWERALGRIKSHVAEIAHFRRGC